MKFSMRAALLAGALTALGGAASAAPVSLAEALARGAEQSPRVAVARARADAAEARARQAGVSPNPELSLELENFAGSGAFKGFRRTETTLAVSQRIELGGKRSARVAVAAAERDFALLSFRAAEVELGNDIRVAHADLRAAQDRAELARDNVAQARELARTAKVLVEAGRDPPLRQLRAAAVLAEAEAEQARAFGELLASRRQLADLIVSDDPELSALVSRGEPAPAPPLPAVPSLDEQLASAERDAALARIRLARAGAVPDVTASAGVRRIGETGEKAFVAGFSIPLPLRDRNRGNIEAAQAESLASEASLRLAAVNARRAQHDARMRLAAADARVAALSGPLLSQAEEAVRLARIGYGAGKFSQLELLDAQAALTAARNSLIEARLDRARALAALIRAQARAGN